MRSKTKKTAPVQPKTLPERPKYLKKTTGSVPRKRLQTPLRYAISDVCCPVCKRYTLWSEPLEPQTPGLPNALDVRVTCSVRNCMWTHTIRGVVTLPDIINGIQAQGSVIAQRRAIAELPDEGAYALACQVKELLDGYELLHVMPPSPDLDYNVLRTELDKQRMGLREQVRQILVRSMGEKILQPVHRNKKKPNANPAPH